MIKEIGFVRFSAAPCGFTASREIASPADARCQAAYRRIVSNQQMRRFLAALRRDDLEFASVDPNDDRTFIIKVYRDEIDPERVQLNVKAHPSQIGRNIEMRHKNSELHQLARTLLLGLREPPPRLQKKAKPKAAGEGARLRSATPPPEEPPPPPSETEENRRLREENEALRARLEADLREALRRVQGERDAERAQIPNQIAAATAPLQAALVAAREELAGIRREIPERIAATTEPLIRQLAEARAAFDRNREELTLDLRDARQRLEVERERATRVFQEQLLQLRREQAEERGDFLRDSALARRDFIALQTEARREMTNQMQRDREANQHALGELADRFTAMFQEIMRGMARREAVPPPAAPPAPAAAPAAPPAPAAAPAAPPVPAAAPAAPPAPAAAPAAPPVPAADVREFRAALEALRAQVAAQAEAFARILRMQGEAADAQGRRLAQIVLDQNEAVQRQMAAAARDQGTAVAAAIRDVVAAIQRQLAPIVRGEEQLAQLRRQYGELLVQSAALHAVHLMQLAAVRAEVNGRVDALRAELDASIRGAVRVILNAILMGFIIFGRRDEPRVPALAPPADELAAGFPIPRIVPLAAGPAAAPAAAAPIAVVPAAIPRGDLLADWAYLLRRNDRRRPHLLERFRYIRPPQLLPASPAAAVERGRPYAEASAVGRSFEDISWPLRRHLQQFLRSEQLPRLWRGERQAAPAAPRFPGSDFVRRAFDHFS